MTSATVKTYAKGQVVIPGTIRKKLHIRPGSRLKIMEYQGIIYLIPPARDAIQESAGWLPKAPDLVADLLSERRR